MMKRAFVGTAALLLSLTACEGQSPEQASLADSRESWVALKSDNGSSYRYTAYDASFTGYHWLTTVEVLQNHVSRRTYLAQTPTGETAATWMEEEAALGTHQQGAPPLTVEAVYDECASEVLTKDPGANLITLTFHADGLLENCSYFPKNCQDDCSIGVTLTTLEFIE